MDQQKRELEYSARLIKREEVASGTYRLEFSIDHASFVFQPGQYLWVVVDKLIVPDVRGERRAFSIAPCNGKDTVAIYFRGAQSGYKKTLLHIPLESQLTLVGPFGHFELPRYVKGQQIIFVAGGVGVSPFLSMISKRLRSKTGPSLHLLYGESTQKRYIPEVLELESKIQKSTFLRITKYVGKFELASIKKVITSHKSIYLLFSGPSEMIESLAPQVLSLGIPRERMIFEESHPFLDKEKMLTTKELARTASRDYYKLAADGSLIHTVITDCNGRILYANNAAARVTGYSLDEMLGNTPRLWGGLSPSVFYKKLWHTIKIKRETFYGKVVNRKKNGAVYISQLSISPIIEPHTGFLRGFVSSENDITEIEEINRAKTEFVSLAAHQLRTPLSAIGWYAELLQEKDAGVLTKKQREYLEVIHHENKRMISLINAMLNVSRIEMGSVKIEPKPTDIVSFAKKIIAEARHSVEQKNIILEERYDRAIPRVNADENLLGIVFQNLISNAIKYTSEKGTISIDISVHKKNSFFDDAHSAIRDSFLIKVSDTGCGIAKDQQDKIFSKFFRSPKARTIDPDGTGLGLYIVKSVVDMNGGSVWFTSKENIGTTFYVVFSLSGMRHKNGSKTLM